MFSLAHTIAAAALALSLATSSVPARQDTAPATPQCSTVTLAGPAQTTSGTGQRNSAPFVLDGGAYQVDWQLATPSDRVTFVDLKSATSESVLDSKVILNASGSTPVSSGQTFLYNVKPGSYYLGVRAPAGWTVTLTPITP